MVDTLEDRISKDHKRIKENTLKAIRMGTPFQFMINVAKVGENYYNVPASDSFWYGLNNSLDDYLSKPKPRTHADMFYSLKHGTEEILRFCYNNYYDYNDYPEDE